MQKKGDKSKGLYKYLDATKVLETGAVEDIQKAKVTYWKNYKAEHRKKGRHERKEYTIALTKSEAKEITDAASGHKRSPTQYIKDSALAYNRKIWVVRDILAIHAIRQELAMNFNLLKTLFDENMVSYSIGTSLLQQMAALEQKVLAELYSTPKTLEQWITETIRNKPEYGEIIRQLLENRQSHDY